MNSDNVEQQKEKLDPFVLQVATVMVVGALVPLLDSTMVNVALNSIVTDMEATISVVQWVTTGYNLAMGLAVPITGWAVTRFGCKRIYLFALIIFLISSIFSVLATNIQSLICFSIIQGIGAGIIMPTLMTEIVNVSGGHHLGRIMAIISIPALLAPIFGPVIGGIIANSLSWRAIYGINVPICMAAIFLTWKIIPADDVAKCKLPLDIIGLLTLSPAMALLIFGISQIASHSGLNSSAVYIPMLVGILFLIVFISHSLKTKKAPILNLRLFSSTNFLVSNILLFMTGIITNGAMLLLPLFYQEVRGQSVLYAGLWLIPQGIGMLCTRSRAGKIADSKGARNIMLTILFIAAVGTVPFAFADANTNSILLAVALLIRGAGMGGIFIVAMTSAYNGLSVNEVPHASTATRIFQAVGGAFGSAIVSTVLVRHQMAAGSISSSTATGDAFNAAFMCIIAFTVIALLPALFLKMKSN